MATDPLRVLSAWCLLITVFLGSVVLNIVQVLATIALMAAGRGAAEQLDARRKLANGWWQLFPFVLEHWGEVEFVFTGDDIDLENAILLGNHTSTYDFTNGVVITSKIEGLGCGRMMTMMKKSLQPLPTVGWTHGLQGSLFLKRNWETDQSDIKRKLEDMENKRFPWPFWIGVFPEGTRITAAKREQSHAFAKERGLPILNNVLLPRTKGVVFLVNNLSTSVKAIYDATIAYSGGPIDFKHALLTGSFKTTAVHVHMRRIPIKDVPKGDDSQWLIDLFVAKDKLLDYQKENDYFPGVEAKLPDHAKENLTQLAIWSLALTFVFGLLGCTWTAVAYAAVQLLTGYTVLTNTRKSRRTRVAPNMKAKWAVPPFQARAAK